MVSLTDLRNRLTGTVTDTATSATQSALDTASARPFNVILSVDDDTKVWITGLGLIAGLIVLFGKGR